MFTTVASRTTMSCARPTVMSVSQRREGAAVFVREDMSVSIYGTVKFRI
jgi:hypothetical protein